MVNAPKIRLRQKFELAQALTKAKLGKFGRDQNGAAFVFAIIIFVLMLMFGGLAVDVVRAENQRIKIQQTLDRAVLAAADLDNAGTPQEVVEDYFDKSGFREYLVEVTVDQGLNARTVTAKTKADVNTLFMHLAGVESLSADGSGGATEQVTDIEISLVVDISGSMGWWNSDYTAYKIDNLKTAAETFFDSVINEQTEESGITMISIVPYNATVNAGEGFLEYFNVTDWHEESHCIRFYDDDFEQRSISRTGLIERVGHFAESQNNYNAPNPEWHSWCPDRPAHAILPFETDQTALETHITGLSAGGWTGIDNGVKWASALLDPEMRTIVNDMVDTDERASIINGWPRDYGVEGTMKVIVLMTDGANTEQWDLPAEYKSTDGINAAKSPIWYSESMGADNEFDGYYIRFPDNNWDERWYRPRNPWYTSDDEWMRHSWRPNDLVRLTYQEVWTRFWTVDAATYFYYYSDPDGSWDYSWSDDQYYWSGAIPQDYYDLRYPAELHDSYGQVDDRLEAICDEVKEENVIIFTIAFEAPADAETVMRYCASTSGHYYDVAGDNLESAFRSIASQINHLRLIQ
ncbi:MAG: TadE/TadG family type IV pilus assembly protein [Pseudomonadota bacterium]